VKFEGNHEELLARIAADGATIEDAMGIMKPVIVNEERALLQRMKAAIRQWIKRHAKGSFSTRCGDGSVRFKTIDKLNNIETTYCASVEDRNLNACIGKKADLARRQVRLDVLQRQRLLEFDEGQKPDIKRLAGGDANDGR
jgi:hypothetical protein